MIHKNAYVKQSIYLSDVDKSEVNAFSGRLLIGRIHCMSDNIFFDVVVDEMRND